MTKISELDNLLRRMRRDDPTLPKWDLLPVYGGEEPNDTERVWSWDSTRLIIGTCPGDVEIVTREEAGFHAKPGA